ncbi:MAG TPA: bifunctional alpha/beta hydrolase/class I SAM-dependent methyltransferase [Gemmataceae bacterium]|nr:bifunctional alpha/beta hydrolase/class I SAM-dependent methyltransferase [Gemmataceae bacterium]
MAVITAKRAASEHVMTTWDGTDLFYRAWLAPTPTDRALLLFHRGHEHSGRFQELVDDLDLEDISVFAWDARGHGRSPGERGYADSFGCLVKDVDAFVRFVSQEHDVPLENMVVMAHSVGAVVAAAWVHDYAPPIRALVLATPALRVKLYVPLAIPILRLLQRVKGKSFIKSYVRPAMLTHDPEQAARYAGDPLISRNIAVNILLGLHDTSTRMIADAGAIRVPTLLLSAGSDWVVKLSAQKKFFDRLGAADKEMEVYPGFHHAVLHEKDRHLPITRAREFVRNAFEHPRSLPRLLNAHRQGYTRSEYDWLLKPLPAWCPRRLGYAALKLSMKTLGRLSTGIRIGWRRGFDSGESLDYIYRNRAEGITLLGKLIDRLYLNSIGWRGIRQRKVILEKTLQAVIERVHTAGRPVRVVDIASGPGRYLLDTLQKLPHLEISAVLRDRSPQGLEAGRKLAREMGLLNVTHVQGDAFDPKSLAEISPRPTIAIVSGLYELFPDNEMILTSLRGLGEVLEDGGYLVYTNQPWHPQVEFIARVLTNRDGRPWIMRRRTQEEMDDLVGAAGFEKLATEIDNYGIFTVSLAQQKGRAPAR